MGEKKGGLTNILMVLATLVIVIGGISLYTPGLVQSVMEGMQGIVDNTVGNYEFNYEYSE